MDNKILEIEPDLKKIFDENSQFHDSNKINKLRRTINNFIKLCKSPNDIEYLKKYLMKIISSHPEVKIQKDIFNKSGFRLLILGIPYSINSGVVTVAKNIIKAFQMKGANIAVVNHWWHRYHYWVDYSDHNKRRKQNVKMSPYSLLTGMGQFVTLKWAFKLILKSLINDYNYKPQICHVHTHTFYEDKAVQYFHKYFPSTPIVFTLHAFIPYLRLSKPDKLRLLNDEFYWEEIVELRKKGYKKRERSQEKMIEISDKVITISQVHKDAFDKIYPEFAQKCVCIPNGTDFELYSEHKEVIEYEKLLRQKIISNNEKTIIYVGRIEEKKNVQILITALNDILKIHPNTKVIFVGPKEQDRIKIFNLGLHKKYSNNLFFAGWVKAKQLASYYRLADVMIQPVFSKDLYAMVALEAMIMKVPVISCPGVLTFENCSSTELIVKAVNKIFTNHKSVQRHVNHVHKQVINDHSLSAIYRKHYEVYKSTKIASSELKTLKY